MKLNKVEIHKYKSFTDTQSFELEDGATILVGMNESGKTSALEAIAKTNYFIADDTDFQFNVTHDYPRREKKKFDKSGENPEAITCHFELSDDEISEIEDDIGQDVLEFKNFSHTTKYEAKDTYTGVKTNKQNFISQKMSEFGLSDETLLEKLTNVKFGSDFETLKTEYSDEKITELFDELAKYFVNSWSGYSDPISEYVARIHLNTRKPKFLYYDEYFALPSRISIEKLNNEELDESDLKTAKALFELADINTEELINSGDFEDFISELEATQAAISNELFKYWSTNQNLDIVFQIDKRVEKNRQNQQQIVEHILDIRVKNKGVSLPLKNRSKGFNWFFSFLVWFKKIQEDTDSDYILLLDEPGLNLHASAQADLLRFLENLSANYQVVYTTHSPFMIPSDSLQRVRTVLETDASSVISDTVQEKDPNTLFPLQAALGYDIAQNLFISKNNLLVEGVSDLVYLTVMSDILKSTGKQGLLDEITIVPTGGLDKVATFISLMRGSKLNIVCLLDSYTDPKRKAPLDKMVKTKIIKEKQIHFFDEFLDDFQRADLEDLFDKSDYLKLYNGAFDDSSDIQLSDLDADVSQILLQINKHLNIKRFNHYRPANYLAQQGADAKYFDAKTLENFGKVFEVVNAHFKN